MATNIFNYDGTLLTTVADGTLDQTHASIKFPGRGYSNYGQPVLESLLWVMQNFAGTEQPKNKMIGQLWYDTTEGKTVLKVWDGETWQSASGLVADIKPPPYGSSPGAFWYDTDDKQLHVWNGAAWDLVGPLGSAINEDPENPAIPDHSAIEAIRVLGVEDNALHQVWRITVGGKILAVLSKDSAFTPQSSLLTSNGFTKIYPGINMNSTIQNIGLSGDTTLFKSIQTNLPSNDLTWDLGSGSKRFNKIYGGQGIFSNRLLVNKTTSQYNFEVNGTSKFNNTVTLGPGSPTYPPLKMTAGKVTVAPQSGAIEFDGTNFYFSGMLNGQVTRRTPVFTYDPTAGRGIFVSATHGYDSNDGRTLATAWRTIAHALEYIKENSLIGYTVYVESGEYVEQNPMYVPPYTGVVADDPRAVVVKPVHDTLDIFQVDENSYVHGITFKDHKTTSACIAFPSSTAYSVLGGLNSDQVYNIKPTFSWSGYSETNQPEVFIEGPNILTGTRATATANVVDGAIVDVIVTAGGSGYTNAAGITFNITGGGTGSGADFVARVSNGAIVAIDIIDCGELYTDPVTLTINSPSGAGAKATVKLADGVIRTFNIVDRGTGYTEAPYVSVKPPVPSVIKIPPVVNDCYSSSGPFDITGKIVNATLPYNVTSPGTGYSAVNATGAGIGIRADGAVLADTTPLRSIMVNDFDIWNQGGIGYLVLNKGQVLVDDGSTVFNAIAYLARGGGIAKITTTTVEYGDIGLKAVGCYPVAYTTGTVHLSYKSSVATVQVVLSGAGYNSDFTVTLDQPTQGYSGTGTPAVCTVRVDQITNTVAAVQVATNYGYTSNPTQGENVTFVTLNGGGGTGATAILHLTENSEIQVDGLTRPPLVGSAMTLNNKLYKITTVRSAGSGNYVVGVLPKITAANAGTTVSFYEVSNIHADMVDLNYIGSGVTYNALARYGGIQDNTKQIVDGSADGSALAPGRVDCISFDNDGIIKFGNYLNLNMYSGNLVLGPKTEFAIPRITSIGPFVRNGVSVGTYADEISNDTSLTHLSNSAYDDTTLPTQNAVRGYIQRISSNVLPMRTNTYSVGSPSYRWKSVNAANIIVDNANVRVANIAAATFSTLSAGIITATNGTITNLQSTVGTIGTLTGSSLNYTLGTVGPATFNNASVTVTGRIDVIGPSANAAGINVSGLVHTTTLTVDGAATIGSLNATNIGIGSLNATSGTIGTLAGTSINYTNGRIGLATFNATNTVFGTRIDVSGLTHTTDLLVDNTATINTLNATTATIGTATITSLNASGGISTGGGLTISPWLKVTGYANISSNVTVDSLRVNGTYVSTGTGPSTAGAVYVAGGVGIGGSVNVGQSITGQSLISTGLLQIGNRLTVPAVPAATLSSYTTIAGGLRVWDGFQVTGLTNHYGGLALTDGTVSIDASSISGIVLSDNSTHLTVKNTGVAIVGSTTISGALSVSGDITAFAVINSPSDQRLKTNMAPITDALTKVNKLNGITFNWTDEYKKYRPNIDGRESGVIAQEVQKVMPEVVKETTDGYLGVAYDKLVPLLIEAIKELTDKVAVLEKKLDAAETSTKTEPVKAEKIEKPAKAVKPKTEKPLS